MTLIFQVSISAFQMSKKDIIEMSPFNVQIYIYAINIREI